EDHDLALGAGHAAERAHRGGVARSAVRVVHADERAAARARAVAAVDAVVLELDVQADLGRYLLRRAGLRPPFEVGAVALLAGPLSSSHAHHVAPFLARPRREDAHRLGAGERAADAALLDGVDQRQGEVLAAADDGRETGRVLPERDRELVAEAHR